jgi:hypothetical protein
MREELMRRNVLTAGLVASALTANWPGSLFGAVPVPTGTTLRAVEQRDSEQKDASAWLWDGMRGPMTLPIGPTWIEFRPDRPCVVVDAGNVH